MGEKPRGRIGGFVARRSTKQKVGGVVGVLLALTAPFGGWQAVDEPPPKPLALGQHFDVGPYDVALEKVVWAKDLAPVVTADPGKRLLVVVATMKNVSDEPQYEILLQDAVRTHGSSVAPAAPTIFQVADGTSLRQINPGVSYRVAIVFQQDTSYSKDSVDLEIGKVTFRSAEDDVLTLDPDVWFNDDGISRAGSLRIKGEV